MGLKVNGGGYATWALRFGTVCYTRFENHCERASYQINH